MALVVALRYFSVAIGVKLQAPIRSCAFVQKATIRLGIWREIHYRVHLSSFNSTAHALRWMGASGVRPEMSPRPRRARPDQIE